MKNEDIADSPFTLFHEQDANVNYDPFELLDSDVKDENDDYDIDEDIPGSVDGRSVGNATVATMPADSRKPEQKIDDLFSRMRTRKRVLLGILSFCIDAQPVALVNKYIDEIEENDASVFPGAKYCEHLQAVGALSCVTADGTLYAKAENEPESITVNGIEFLQAAKPTEAFWITTPIGNEVLATHRPIERIRELFAQTPSFLPIYKYVLEMCARESGCTIVELGKVIDDHPLVQKPRRYAQYFIDQLEKHDAIIWKKRWFITEVGITCLADLNDAPALENTHETLLSEISTYE